MILRDPLILRGLMRAHGLTQRDLATAAGYRNHGHVSRLTRGETTSIGDDYALRIAHRLRVAVDVLFLPESSSDSGRIDPTEGRRV